MVDNPVILNIHHNAFLKGLLIQTGRKTANASDQQEYNNLTDEQG
jgi:hypothetical protein